MSRRVITACLFSALAILTASADGGRLRPSGGCIVDDVPTQTHSAAVRAANMFRGEVCVPLILAAFQDVPFTTENVQEVWSDIANKPGYSDHGANGSMADYFLEQSRGLFRISFDVLGPVTLPRERAYYGAGTDTRVSTMIRQACEQAVAEAGADLSRYDWNGDGSIETVLVLYAGPGENVMGAPADLIWPKMGYAPYAVGNHHLSRYACANELVWPDMQQDGFGTLLHEFSHCLGLPDLYNVIDAVDDYIIFDEWDVMDGGCYSGDSWQPVGYSAYERYLCGWLEPEELTEPVDIEGMKPLNDVVRNDAHPDELFMLENRQQQSFDKLLPGHGLLVTHISNISSTSLQPNAGSNITVSPVPADNLDYPLSVRKYVQDYYGVTLPDNQLNLVDKYKAYRYDENGRSRLMADLAYPYTEGDVIINDWLTDDSTPAAVLTYAGTSGSSLLSKPITDIRQRDGLISFKFMNPTTAIVPPSAEEGRGGHSSSAVAYYDLHGRPVMRPASGAVTIVRHADGSIRKIVR